MGFIITPGFVEAKIEKELYKKEYIRKSIENLVNLVEEKKEGIKCDVQRKILSRGEFDVEVIAVRCIDYSSFPISTITIPIVATQEIEEGCGCRTIEYMVEYLNNRDSALVDTVFEWLQCQDCKTKKLWEIMVTLGLNKIIDYNQIVKLFIPDLSILR
jgi:hypothetical protein